MRHCCGLWVLSNYNKSFSNSCALSFPVSSIYYPMAVPNLKFDLQALVSQKFPALLFIGEYLRQVQPFLDLDAPGYRKIVLQLAGDRGRTWSENRKSPVLVIDRVDNAEYDRMLARSVVFLI